MSKGYADWAWKPKASKDDKFKEMKRRKQEAPPRTVEKFCSSCQRYVPEQHISNEINFRNGRNRKSTSKRYVCKTCAARMKEKGGNK